MANLFKKSTTRPMPEGAELLIKKGQAFARWTVNGKTRIAPVNDAGRIVTDSATWYAKYRGADGIVVEAPTGCRDKGAAMARMNAMVTDEERIRSGVVTASETKTAKHGQKPYADTVTAFIDSMTARKCAESTCYDWKRYLESAGIHGLGWRTLHDMDRAELERWLSMRAVTPKNPEKPDSLMGARLHNVHTTTFNAFGTWCARQGYVKANPFADMVKRDEQADRRHIRRALTQEELSKLIQAALTRPLEEAYRGNKGRGKAQKEAKAKLTDATIDAMQWLGRVRATAYKLAVLTGLRWGELRSITIGACRLDNATPHLVLQARDEKARRGAQIPVATGFVPELKDYLAERLARLTGQRGASVVVFPGVMDSEPLFDVPENMSKVFKADALAAGLAVTKKVKSKRKDKDGKDVEVKRIDTRDSAGRVIDVHALRHTFGTMLAKSGVSLQVAQKAMRHSTPVLTANVYTHLGLMDVAGAVNAMPPIKSADQGGDLVAPMVAPAGVISWSNQSIPVIPALDMQCSGVDGKECVLSADDAGIRNLSEKKNGGRYWTRTSDILRVRQAL